MISSFSKYLILNLFKNVSSAYSLRRLKSTSIKCVNVRRSSDDADLDIGFFGAWLDIPTLLAFVGAGSGYVVTWYDQSGNGYDLSQATNDNQPRIVNNGALETQNNLPSIFFDGSNDNLSNASVSISNILTVFSVCKTSVTDAVFRRLYNIGDDTLGVNSFTKRYNGSTTAITFGNRLPETQSATITSSLSNLTLVSGTRSSTSLEEIWKNGASRATNTNTTTTFTATKIEIGGSGSFCWNGYASEIITYPALDNHSRAKIENDILKLYSIS